MEKYVAGVENDPARLRVSGARGLVRRLRYAAVLSPEWLDVTNALESMEAMAVQETHLADGASVAGCKGRKDGEGTLWDQQNNEGVVRTLVEEAKVNLCLRLMHDFKAWQADSTTRDREVQAWKRGAGMTDGQVDRTFTTFEESLGSLLLRAFLHVEAMQLTDVPLLMQYIVSIVEGSRTRKFAAGTFKRQETVAPVHYFLCLGKHCDELGSGTELLGKLQETGLVMHCVRHLLEHVEEYRASAEFAEVCMLLARGLAYFADNEDFATEWSRFVTDYASFVKLAEIFEGLGFFKHEDLRVQLRPLQDLCAKARRAARPSAVGRPNLAAVLAAK